MDTVRWCMEAGVKILTVYAFSTENWKREEKEIDVLMTIFCKYAERCEQEALEKNIRIRIFCTDKDRVSFLPLSCLRVCDLSAWDRFRPFVFAIGCTVSPKNQHS